MLANANFFTIFTFDVDASCLLAGGADQHNVGDMDGSLNGSNAACYKAVDKEAEKFLLKCEVCGRLVRFSCRDLENLYKHFNRAHNYAINPYKTVFYGRCDRCKEGQNA